MRSFNAKKCEVRRRAGERSVACNELKQYDAKCPQIGFDSTRFAADCSWTHILGSAYKIGSVKIRLDNVFRSAKINNFDVTYL